MPRYTKKFLEAKCEALQASVDALTQEITRLRRDKRELSDQLAIHSRVPQLAFDELQARARSLTKQGVPCKIFRGHIIHAITGAVLL